MFEIPTSWLLCFFGQRENVKTAKVSLPSIASRMEARTWRCIIGSSSLMVAMTSSRMRWRSVPIVIANVIMVDVDGLT